MKLISPVLIIVFSCAGIACSKSDDVEKQPPVIIPVDTSAPKTYQLVWSDEFDKDGLPDDTKWGYDVGGSGWGNNELEYYTNARTENARVENGNLVIEARKENVGDKNYSSARLLTKNKASWTYGRFEIRAKVPNGRGIWPAIWMLSANEPLRWPDDGELDIMEEVGFDPNVIHATVHNKAYNGANGLQKGSQIVINDADDSFHVYSMEWTANKVSFAVDGNIYFVYSDPGVPGTWPYSNNFFMILNVAVGGNWGGQKGIDDSAFPQQMLVDYVRVYQLK